MEARLEKRVLALSARGPGLRADSCLGPEPEVRFLEGGAGSEGTGNLPRNSGNSRGTTGLGASGSFSGP